MRARDCQAHYLLEPQSLFVRAFNPHTKMVSFACLPLVKRLPLMPDTPYDLTVWKKAKLHRDCHVVFDNAYYSAPFRLVGQPLYARGGDREVRLYDSQYQLVATQERAQAAGQRHTHPAHLPPDLLPGLYLDRAGCLTAAADIGPETARLTASLLADYDLI